MASLGLQWRWQGTCYCGYRTPPDRGCGLIVAYIDAVFPGLEGLGGTQMPHGTRARLKRLLHNLDRHLATVTGPSSPAAKLGWKVF